jgi:hypothetical protein
MNSRTIYSLLWTVLCSIFLLTAAPGFAAAQPLAPLAPQSTYLSSTPLNMVAPERCAGARLPRKAVSLHTELRRRSDGVVTIAHRRVHRRFGVEKPAATADPFFLQIGQSFDTNIEVRSSARSQSNGRSPPNPSI